MFFSGFRIGSRGVFGDLCVDLGCLWEPFGRLFGDIFEVCGNLDFPHPSAAIFKLLRFSGSFPLSFSGPDFRCHFLRIFVDFLSLWSPLAPQMGLLGALFGSI